MQAPSVGRIVHYQSHGTPGGEYPSKARAAIITEIGESFDGTPRISLCVLNPVGMFFDQYVPYSEEPKPGHWSWPPRV